MLSKTISVKILMIRIASAVYAIPLASATTQRFLQGWTCKPIR
jgi:hypothetical protein